MSPFVHPRTHSILFTAALFRGALNCKTQISISDGYESIKCGRYLYNGILQCNKNKQLHATACMNLTYNVRRKMPDLIYNLCNSIYTHSQRDSRSVTGQDNSAFFFPNYLQWADSRNQKRHRFQKEPRDGHTYRTRQPSSPFSWSGICAASAGIQARERDRWSCEWRWRQSCRPPAEAQGASAGRRWTAGAPWTGSPGRARVGGPVAEGQRHPPGAPTAQEDGPLLSHTEAAYCSMGSQSPLEMPAGFEMCSLL